MGKFSGEVTAGLIFEVIVGILDHLHVNEPVIIWVLFLLGLLLIADSVVRGDWANRIQDTKARQKKRFMWGGFALTGFLVFGVWVYHRLDNLHEVVHRQHVETVSEPTATVPAPSGSSPSIPPPPLVRKSKHANLQSPVNQTCVGSNCAEINNGTMQINRLEVPFGNLADRGIQLADEIDKGLDRRDTGSGSA